MKRIVFALVSVFALVGGVLATSASASTHHRHRHHGHPLYNVSIQDYCAAFYHGNAYKVDDSADGWRCVYNAPDAEGQWGRHDTTVDINAWCAHIGEGHAVLIYNNAEGWRCTQPVGPAVRLV